jgi:uncharacterized membrane protein YtjA (UPF0391 family)
MLHWALVFFVISLIAGFFGFSGISVATAGIAKILFVGFIVVAIGLATVGVVTGRKLVKN